MRRLAMVSVAFWLLSTGCILGRSRATRLPATIPAVEGKPRIAFALRHIDVRAGTGALARPRACLYAHYTGWLTDGTKFDSSRDTMPNGTPRTPIVFAQGAR